ncbi:cytochrome c oxidase assembly protein [Chelatococcus daeguensis]|uniref:Cytochrome c oxidase assembly protein CtaG n=2 Tax=Chelatococcus TaxID=28209 RepID=A0AAC9JQ84_9HYPH|nr:MULTISPECIES: cytochrome c oxidase assembly protein [Chelatococcus]APF36895.1 cytochrome c oxidase assembly protein [Chelatococcus daeguensis]KZE28078.1 cytochrome C oxidase assembly protein [Chelatococcus daeguensis]MBM3084654.1 cytochrome c oxidase assembly protein [Chelatococcus daeguensis]CUA88228.1 Cytochrome c oxidase assembly protein Cox11 [Chelatococcus sambhunathii]
MSSNGQDPKVKAAVRRTAVICAGVVVGMVGLAYASVPLYDLFCRVTGYGGTPQISDGPSARRSEREVTVRFDSNVAPGISWRFTPEAREVTVKLGETKTVMYKFTNTSDRPTTGIATFNVQPELAGAYFNKIQCFCFTEQTLQPGETVEAPVVFYVDPDIVNERDIADIRTLTLSYTVFPAKGGAPVTAASQAVDKPSL